MKEKHKIAIIVGGVIIIAIASRLYFNFLSAQPQDYTVGVITKIYKPKNRPTRISFEYFVNGKRYESSVSYAGREEVSSPGNRFLVHYAEGFYVEGKMLTEYPIKDSIIAPVSGWDEIPESIKKLKTSE